MDAPTRARPAPRRIVGAGWGLLGITLVLGDAIVRVWPYTSAALRHGLDAGQWGALVVWVGAMVVAEGYRGFQKRFSPRVAARGLLLLHHGHGIDLLLAPLYCMGFFHAARRQIITSWCLTAGIVALIVVVRTFDQPWRGIIDAGVVAGLAYGLVSIYGCAVVAWRQSRNETSLV